MDTEDEETLLALGQQLADEQTLDTLISLDPVARQQFDYIYSHYSNMRLEDFVQMWRDVFE